MILPGINPRPVCFVLAKWISIVAVAATPLTFVVAAIMENAETLDLAIGCVIVVPLLAVMGYWSSLLVYSEFHASLAQTHLDDAPENGSSLFQFLKRIRRKGLRLNAVIALILFNVFAVAWSGFLLFYVILGMVAGLRGKL